MPLIVYGIPNCDSVKRARAWLAENRIEADFHDFKKRGVPPERLDAWIAALGWEPLVNRKGTAWRRLDDPTRASVRDAASARALMLAHPSVIRRPVIEWPSGTVSAGVGIERWPLT
jgi:arsenate reductase